MTVLEITLSGATTILAVITIIQSRMATKAHLENIAERKRESAEYNDLLDTALTQKGVIDGLVKIVYQCHPNREQSAKVRSLISNKKAKV